MIHECLQSSWIDWIYSVKYGDSVVFPFLKIRMWNERVTRLFLVKHIFSPDYLMLLKSFISWHLVGRQVDKVRKDSSWGQGCEMDPAWCCSLIRLQRISWWRMGLYEPKHKQAPTTQYLVVFCLQSRLYKYRCLSVCLSVCLLFVYNLLFFLVAAGTVLVSPAVWLPHLRIGIMDQDLLVGLYVHRGLQEHPCLGIFFPCVNCVVGSAVMIHQLHYPNKVVPGPSIGNLDLRRNIYFWMKRKAKERKGGTLHPFLSFFFCFFSRFLAIVLPIAGIKI